MTFCNDIHKVLEFCNCILFADDTTIYKTHSNERFLEWSVNEDLKLISDWFKANKLTLNLNKTVCMLFNYRSKNATQLKIRIDDVVIPQVPHTKFLGLYLDEKLNWKKHLDQLIRKIKSNTKLLRENKKLVSTHVEKILYYSQIFSHINYGICVWGNHLPNHAIDQLQKLQNKCISIVGNVKKTSPSQYKNLRILRIDEIIKLENLKFAYKLNNDLLPVKIKECTLQDHKGSSLLKKHSYNTRGRTIPNTPKVTGKFYLESVFCKSIKIFGTLKGKTQRLPTLISFTKKCKDMILKGELK